MSILGDIGNAASSLGGLFGIGGSSVDKSAPISLTFKSAQSTSLASILGAGLPGFTLPSPPALALGVGSLLSGSTALKTFTSYSFQRSVLTPGTPFRFTAPGIDKKTRMGIRSGDTVQLVATSPAGTQVPLATGFIDQTDTHISPNTIEYILTGRDTLGQLIDNTVVDAKNKVIQTKNLDMPGLVQLLVNNTRMPQTVTPQQIDSVTLLFQTTPGETKMNTLQRYLEFTNCLVWTLPNGQMVIGKPNTQQTSQGMLACGTTGAGPSLPSPPSISPTQPQSANVLDCRVTRDVNTAIRQIVVQLQDLNNVDAGAYTIINSDSDVQAITGSGGGRSVYDVFSYGQGADLVNFLKAVGNFSAAPDKLGAALAQRTLARENVKVLEVEVTVQGHFNTSGNVYDVDQIYDVSVPDEDIQEKMYVYDVTHELTIEHGMTTKLRLCKAGGTLVAGQYQMPIVTLPIL